MDFEYVLGSALIKTKGRRREGVARIEKVAKAGSGAGDYALAGATLLELNEYEQARKDLEEALRLNPRLPGLYTLVGTARDKTGDVKDAEPAFREALKTNPDDFDANLYLGAILYKRRDVEEAKGYLEHALRLRPTDSIARYEAAMLKSTSGKITKPQPRNWNNWSRTIRIGSSRTSSWRLCITACIVLRMARGSGRLWILSPRSSKPKAREITAVDEHITESQ